jgi:glycosyltransferase involved in cell wall biosynthesis
MPVYNGERFLKEALDALLSQSFTDWTLLISDDASGDKTKAIVQEYANRDSRITYVRQESNLGIFKNFKYTLDQADGKYFMWAAQDDLWEKSFLRTCVDILDKDESIGLTGTNMMEIDSYGRTIRELPWLEKLSGKPGIRSISHYILEPEILGKCNIMYGVWRIDAVKTVWRAFPQRKVWGQDYMFVLAGISRYKIRIDGKMLFKKRLGGYSSEGALDKDGPSEVQKRIISDPKDYIFPLGRFGIYFKGHMEALSGTPYQLLGAALLLTRLPRAFWNHIKK